MIEVRIGGVRIDAPVEMTFVPGRKYALDDRGAVKRLPAGGPRMNVRPVPDHIRSRFVSDERWRAIMEPLGLPW